MPLFPDQLQALADFDAAVHAGARAPIIVAPTAFGKTRMAAARMAQIIAAGGRVWFLAHLQELLIDTAARLAEDGIEPSWIWADRPYNPRAGCQLVSLQSAAARLGSLGPRPGLVIIDECHRATAPTYQAVLDALGRPLVMGLSGTPIRLDGRPLRHGGFDALIRTSDTIDLIEAGRLSPLKAWSFPQPGSLVGGQIMEGRYLLGNALEHWADRARERPTVIFCDGVPAAKDTAEEWRRNGFRALAVDGKSSANDRRDALAAARAHAIDALVCADLYVAGLDLPDLGCVVCLRPTDSLVVWLQMVGRGLRKSNVWPDCYLHDHAGNCRRPGLGHPLERRMHLWSLDGVPGVGRGGRKNPWDDILPAKYCEKCYSCDMTGNRCNECGHVKELRIPPGMRVVDGELVPVDHQEEKYSDLTFKECCKRWAVASPNAIKARAKALGVEFRRETRQRVLWPAEYVALGDDLAEHLKKPGATIAGFGRSLTPQAPIDQQEDLLLDLTIHECCERWGVASHGTITARAEGLGVKLSKRKLEGGHCYSLWPAEHLALGDDLAKHLKKPGATIGNFGRSLIRAEDTPGLITREEAIDILGIKMQQLYRAMSVSAIPGKYVGTRQMVVREGLEQAWKAWKNRSRQESQCRTLEDWISLGRHRNYANPVGWARVRFGLRSKRGVAHPSR